ncbi:MAG: GAF domain-containing protein [Myxococcales bacterium]|nr:GAF domain-containing protein [Myxococcales bacterium]
MPKFEVHIPPADEGGFNITLRVDADNWMAALKTGLQKLGEQGANVQNVLVDIQDDNSLHVTESRSGRVFRIRELSEQESATAKVKRTLSGVPAAQLGLPAPQASAPQEPITSPSGQALADDEEDTDPGRRPPDEAPAPTAPVAPPVAAADLAATFIAPQSPQAAIARPIEQPAAAGPIEQPLAARLIEQPAAARPIEQPAAAGPIEQLAAAPPAPPPAKPAEKVPTKRIEPPMSALMTPFRGSAAIEPRQVDELEKPTRPIAGPIGRPRPTKERKQEIEDVLAEVFDRVQEIYSKHGEEQAMYFLLDLALEKIAADSGSVYRADAASGDLSFVAVRGPKADELLKARLVVPAGTGIVGFCAAAGVSLAVSDVERDPRYYAAVSEKLHYETKSVLCAPMMTHGRSFGCVQLLNRKGAPSFTEPEMGILSYVAHQAALYLNDR